ncbi:MAG: hypothetical protein MJD61_06555 [Proteobacteria bacterium]|nr:hypothetical protein [Pseudomonadota bacterium]
MSTPPDFEPARALDLLRTSYGLDFDARLTQLPSERDQNFRMTTPSGDAFVLRADCVGTS